MSFKLQLTQCLYAYNGAKKSLYMLVKLEHNAPEIKASSQFASFSSPSVVMWKH